MVGGYAVVFVISRYLFRRDLMTAALQALAIAGPAVPFVGVSVLGHLFGDESAIPISVASLAMNLVQVPLALMLLSAGAAQRDQAGSGTPAPSLWSHVVGALREPVVWAPLLALVLVVMDLHFPPQIEESLTLLGKATGGVALFASGIVLFSRRVAVSLPVVVSVAARNLAIPAVVWVAWWRWAWHPPSRARRCSPWPFLPLRFASFWPSSTRRPNRKWRRRSFSAPSCPS